MTGQAFGYFIHHYEIPMIDASDMAEAVFQKSWKRLLTTRLKH